MNPAKKPSRDSAHVPTDPRTSVNVQMSSFVMDPPLATVVVTLRNGTCSGTSARTVATHCETTFAFQLRCRAAPESRSLFLTDRQSDPAEHERARDEQPRS